MATNKTKFLSVDVWKSSFGNVATKAVFEIYAKTFDIEKTDMKNHSFRDCVDALRQLEKPDYKPIILS